MLGPKCSVCKKAFKKGDFMAAIGESTSFAASFFGRGGDWPMIGYSTGSVPAYKPPTLYCKSCFDNKFRKNKK